MNKVLKFILCLLGPLSVGALSGIATAAGVRDWYLTLEKPFFNPPNYLFAPVWTVLYLLMGISFYFVLQKAEGSLKRKAMLIFGIQLLLNFLWSFLFFKFQMVGLALVDILLLWSAILMMLLTFYKINRTAAWMQLPYLLWVAFATVLNASIWILN